MKTVYKYQIELTDQPKVQLPKGAEILCVQPQHGALMLWARVNTEQPLEDRYVRIAGTGHPLEGAPGRYINTFFIHQGSLVFHVFEAH